MAATFKVLSASLGLASLFAASYHVCTEVGLRTEGWHEVTVELPRHPGYAAVGQSFATPDGSKVLVTAVTRERDRYRIHANIHGTHRHALSLFPVRWQHAFAMDMPGLEWTLQRIAGTPPAPHLPAGRQWHVLN